MYACTFFGHRDAGKKDFAGIFVVKVPVFFVGHYCYNYIKLILIAILHIYVFFT